MQQIKRIMPFSLAKYASLIAAISVLLLAIVRIVYYVFQNQVPFSMIWQSVLIDALMQTIMAYVSFWIIGYLFGLLYNFLARKTRGILIDLEEVDLSMLKHKKSHDKQEESKKDVIEDTNEDKKFVV